MSSLYKKHVLNIKKLLSNINHLQQSTHVQKRGKITARRRKMNRYEKMPSGQGQEHSRSRCDLFITHNHTHLSIKMEIGLNHKIKKEVFTNKAQVHNQQV